MVKAFYFTLLMVFSVFFTACGSVYYSAELDPQTNFNQHDSLTIFLGENPTILDKKFGILLGENMVDMGYSIAGFNVERAKTPCYVTFILDTKSSRYTGAYTTYNYNTVTSSSFTPGAFGNGYNPMQTTTTTTTTATPMTNFYSLSVLYKSVAMGIFCTENQKPVMVWFGSLTAEYDQYEKYQNEIIRHLVSLIGKEFKGNVSISKLRSQMQNLKNN